MSEASLFLRNIFNNIFFIEKLIQKNWYVKDESLMHEILLSKILFYRI